MPFLVLVGDIGGPDQLDGHDVEARPVDALERYGRVGDPAVEVLAGNRHGPAEEVVETGADLGEPLVSAGGVARAGAPSRWSRTVARQESVVHDRELDSGDEHDLGPSLAGAARPAGRSRRTATGFRRGSVPAGRARTRPPARVRRRMRRGELEPFRIAAGDLDGVAVQVVADDGQFALDHRRVEALARGVVATNDFVL